MFWMLVVETIAKICRLSLVQGKSIKAICRELKISRKVVRKVLRSGETEFRYERKHQPYPRMGAWREELDRLLSANAAKSQRERLTLIRIYEELRGLGYDGSYSSVWRHAQNWEADRGSAAAEAYIPLSFAPGEWVLPSAMEKVRRKLKLADDGDRQMVSILTCVLTDGISAVEAACQEALEHGVSSAAVILNILARSRDPAPDAILSIPQALKLAHEPIADCARYDSLRRINSHGTHRSIGPDGNAEALRDALGL